MNLILDKNLDVMLESKNENYGNENKSNIDEHEIKTDNDLSEELKSTIESKLFILIIS